MKIAVIYLGRRGSGGPISLALSQALAGSGIQVQAFLSTGLETLPAWKAVPFPVRAVPTYGGAAGAAFSLLFPGRVRRLADLIRAWGPDGLVFPMFHPWNALLEGFLADIPGLVFVHDPLAHPGLTGWLHARFEDASLGRAAGCFVLSQGFVPLLARRGVAEGRIRAVPHGPLVYPRPGRSGKPHPPTLLFFGRITAYKGLEVLLPAFARLQARRPELRLILAGAGSLAPYRRWLDSLKNVEVINRWLGEDEIPALFSRASQLILPYTGATQSGVLAIAAGFGLAVVATRAGGLVEQIQDGETGLLVAPGSAEELARAVERLLDDPLLARRLGAALQADFELERSWDQAGAQIIRFLEELPPPGSRRQR